MDIDFNQPQVMAALVAGIVALVVGILTVFATWLVAERKLRADRNLAISEKAWTDYERRRDVYFDFAEQVSCLFAGGDPAGKPQFHKTARKIRLVGSDRVVKALNEFTNACRSGQPDEISTQAYGALFNAMRQDIREIRALPPEGTDLGRNAFPIEA